ncbi:MULTISPECIES: hypothetical protein [unclassified Mesorhizobium]|uniref:hypothetical protein n=1 Tax=unclassified Mesorhizobium TaxID=325217 RepID=UPI001FDFA15A|nr:MULTISPECIES: hypothetical protein [unclassified Mesorhizobium]
MVVGATSEVGAAASARLQQQGHLVRGVARSLGVALSDRGALNRTFAGADSAYLMIPFDVQARDLHRFQRDIGNRLAEAISASGVRRVVLLSGLNAHVGEFADALIETATSFNNGGRWALKAPGPRNTSPTTLERWADDVFGASRHAA